MCNDSDNNKLTNAAKIYCENRSDINFITLLVALRKCDTWVPMMAADDGAIPYILESEDGMKFYPTFSEESQIPDEYAESLTWAQIPFETSARFILDSAEINNMLLNAFTNSVVISEENLRVLMKENAAERVVDESVLKLITADGDKTADEIKRRAYKFFYDRKDVKKAYFAKLLNGKELSYVFIVDVDGDAQAMFKELFEAIGEANITMPIDYTVYPSLKEQLEEIDCLPFFTV